MWSATARHTPASASTRMGDVIKIHILIFCFEPLAYVPGERYSGSCATCTKIQPKMPSSLVVIIFLKPLTNARPCVILCMSGEGDAPRTDWAQRGKADEASSKSQVVSSRQMACNSPRAGRVKSRSAAKRAIPLNPHHIGYSLHRAVKRLEGYRRKNPSFFLL